MTKRYVTLSNASFLELARVLKPNERRNEDERGLNLVLYVQTNGDGVLGQVVFVPAVAEALTEPIRGLDAGGKQ